MRHLAPAAVAALALLLQGCLGGDDEEPIPAPPGPGPAVEADPERDPGSEAVIAVTEEAAATRNGDDCDRLATPAYLQQREHRRGIAALDACQKGVFDRDRGLLDGPVQVGDVRIAGDRAVAIVALQGDGYAGLTARLRLVGGWRLDRIERFIEPQRRELERLLRAEVIAGEIPFAAGAAECAAVEAGRLSDRRLERLLLAPAPDQIYALVLSCAKDDALALATRELPPGLARVPRSLKRCARQRLSALPDGELIQILVDRDVTGTVDTLVACDRAAVLAAYRKELTSPPLSMPPARAECVIRGLSALPAGELVRVFTDHGIQDRVQACGSGKPQ